MLNTGVAFRMERVVRNAGDDDDDDETIIAESDLFGGSVVIELELVVLALLFFQIILQFLHLLLHRLLFVHQ